MLTDTHEPTHASCMNVREYKCSMGHENNQLNYHSINRECPHSGASVCVCATRDWTLDWYVLRPTVDPNHSSSKTIANTKSENKEKGKGRAGVEKQKAESNSCVTQCFSDVQ